MYRCEAEARALGHHADPHSATAPPSAVVSPGPPGQGRDRRTPHLPPPPPHRDSRTAPSGTAAPAGAPRSEEHTSELQSRGQLVCRLLLEKKKRRTAARPR